MTRAEHLATLEAALGDAVAHETEARADLDACALADKEAHAATAAAKREEGEAEARLDAAGSTAPIRSVLEAREIRASAERREVKAITAEQSAQVRVRDAERETARATYELLKETANTWADPLDAKIAKLAEHVTAVRAIVAEICNDIDEAATAGREARALASKIGISAIEARLQVQIPHEDDARAIVAETLAKHSDVDVSAWIALPGSEAAA